MKHKHPTRLPTYCTPPISIVMAADGSLPPPLRFDGLRRPLRHLREQFKLMTGWGLRPPRKGSASVSRVQHPVDNQGLSLSFLEAGTRGGQQILFIHGSPGRGDEWMPFLQNCGDGQHRVAMDRAGYGQSKPAAPLPSVTAQADAIAPLLTKGCVIVGYSYGATVALQLSLDYPDLVAGLLLIGCPIDAAAEHVHPLQRLAATPFMARLLPQGLHSSNMELLPFRSDLEKLVQDLARVKGQVTIMQGMRDTLVPKSNADLLIGYLSNPAGVRIILLPDGDHYLPWTHRATIEQALGYVLRDCEGSKIAGHHLGAGR